MTCTAPTILRNTKYGPIVVDKEDAAICLRYVWGAVRRPGATYAAACVGGVTVYLHRLLMNPAAKRVVDHIDGNGLNNIRSNLRVCSRSQNALNSKKRLGDRASSRFRGVWLNKKNNKWTAMANKDGRRVFLGAFADEESAALAFDAFSIENNKGFARLNFPERRS